MAFDKISLARDTKQNILDNKSKLAPFEVAIAADTDEMIWVDDSYTIHATGGKKSSSVTDGGDVLATAEAVKVAYQKAVDAYNLANSKANASSVVGAGNGLVGGGAIGDNPTLNIGANNDSIAVGADGIHVTVVDSISDTRTHLPASANACKVAYDNAIHAQNLANNANNNANGRCPQYAGNGVLHINGWAIHIN